jgi:hypothetical protein
MFDNDNSPQKSLDEDEFFDEVQNKTTMVMDPIDEELEANNDDIKHEVQATDADEDLERDLGSPSPEE